MCVQKSFNNNNLGRFLAFVIIIVSGQTQYLFNLSFKIHLPNKYKSRFHLRYFLFYFFRLIIGYISNNLSRYVQQLFIYEIFFQQNTLQQITFCSNMNFTLFHSDPILMIHPHFSLLQVIIYLVKIKEVIHFFFLCEMLLCSLII